MNDTDEHHLGGATPSRAVTVMRGIVWLVVAVLAARATLAAVIHWSGATTHVSPVAEHQIDALAAELEPLRPALPHAGVMGYLTDRDPNQVPSEARFLHIQYVLIPVVLDTQEPRAISLVDLDDASDLETFCARHGVEPMGDASGPVFLARRLELP